MMDIHVKGTFLCSQRVGREMVKQKKGSIINDNYPLTTGIFYDIMVV